MSLLSRFLDAKRTDLAAAILRLHAACTDVNGVDLTVSGVSCTIGRHEITVSVTGDCTDEGGYELTYLVAARGYTVCYNCMRHAVDAFAAEIVKAEQEQL